MGKLGRCGAVASFRRLRRVGMWENWPLGKRRDVALEKLGCERKVLRMISIRRGAIHLFRFAGIDLFLHWSWFSVAAVVLGERAQEYSSITWQGVVYHS